MSALSRRRRKARAAERASAQETIALLGGITKGMKVRSRVDARSTWRGELGTGEYGVVGEVSERNFFEVLWVGGRKARYAWDDFRPNVFVWLAP